jgi:GT2 family glycosyltransferase
VSTDTPAFLTKKPVVLAVCLPNMGQIHIQTMRSLLDLDIPKPYHCLDRREVTIDQARNELTGAVIYDLACADVTHLLWIDDDMVFAPDSLQRLLAHDLDIVGGLCHGRRAPHYAPILLKKQGGSLMGYAYQHDYIRGLVEVDATGGAFLLVKREVFVSIENKFTTPGEGPWSHRGSGEDTAFCERAKECGYKIFVDTSLEIGHIAEVVVDSAFSKKNRVSEFNPWYPLHPSVTPGTPVASIIIPTWNQKPELLRAAVHSAITQTVPVEVIVVDDGSDQPVRLDNLFTAGTQIDGNVRLIHIAHAGPWAAINEGIKTMGTKWFCWLSSDDTYRPDKVARQLRAMLATGSVASCHAFDILTEAGLSPQAYVPYQWRSLAEQQHILAAGCAINGLTAMIHASVFEEVGLFNEAYTIVADWDMWNKIGQKYQWLVLSDLLATRRGFDNASERYANDPVKRKIWLEEDAAIRAKYGAKCAACGGALR